MRILKVICISLVLVTGIFGCKKSEMSPGHGSCNKSETSEQNGNKATAKLGSTGSTGEVGSSSSVGTDTGIVGSGDDDREGGDKKRKLK